MQVGTNLSPVHPGNLRGSRRTRESAMLFQTLRSTLTARRIALVAAPLAVFGAAVSTASAADRDGWWHRSSRGPSVVIHASIPGPRIVIGRRVEVVDEVPAALQMTAYQSKDRIIVIVNGTNRGSGFRTSLTQAGFDDRSPSLVLRNTAPEDGCREGATAFTLTAGIHADRDVSRICIRIGARSFDVPITCVQSIS